MDERPEESIAAPTHKAGQSIQSVKDLAVQLFTITAGVLIALSLEGLVGWNNNRLLVREAKATIAREISDNKDALDRHLADSDARMTDTETSLRLANELLATRKSDIRELQLQFHLASLSAAGWHTAERTNALAYMDYPDVQEYAKLYDLQNMYVNHQQRVMDRTVSELSKLAGGDPHQAPPEDLQRFRQELQELSGDLLVDVQLGKQLSARYKEMLARP